MPRAKRKPPVLDAPQASHGERAELQRAQREAPAPAPPGGAQGASPAAGPPPSPSPQRPDPAEVLRTAQTQMPTRGVGIGDPSMRPGEPITSGAPTGPGPGPVRQLGNTARMLERMAALSDDPNMIRLAQRAALKGM